MGDCTEVKEGSPMNGGDDKGGGFPYLFDTCTVLYPCGLLCPESTIHVDSAVYCVIMAANINVRVV